MNPVFRKTLLGLLAALVGVQACKKEADPTPVFAEITPGQGLANALVTIKGTGLNDIQKITFGDVTAPFNPVYNTEGVVMVRVPETAKWGLQKIMLTNAAGKILELPAPFKVLQPAPVLTDMTPISGGEGTVVTLRGRNFDNLLTVKFGDLTANVLSKSSTVVKVEAPVGVVESDVELTTEGGSVKSATKFSPERVIILADFDGNGLRGDPKSWYNYGDILEVPTAVAGGNPGKCLRATVKTTNAAGFAGFSTWDWDATVWKGFPLTQTNPDKILLKLDVHGKAGTTLDVQLSDGGNFAYRIPIDGTGWKSVAFKLSDMGFNNDPTNKTRKIDPTKLGKTLKFAFVGYAGKGGEVLLDNVRMTELK